MINEIDQDGNGCISFNEFVYLMTKNVHEVTAEQLVIIPFLETTPFLSAYVT